MDPFLSKNRTNRDLLSLCYDPLVSVDSSFDPICIIASEYEVYDDKVVFTLRQDACFFDGANVTAADCEYSYSIASNRDSVAPSPPGCPEAPTGRE